MNSLKIENYVGFQSYKFIDALPADTKNQIKTFHFLPSITPDFDKDGEGRRPNTEAGLLSQLSNLTELHLSYNGLQTASFLADMPKLEVLNLDFNNITDFKPVLSLKDLKRLSMVVNPLNVKEFESALKTTLPTLKYQIGNAP
jgi:Leucine-rich repeat (LRR) protein